MILTRRAVRLLGNLHGESKNIKTRRALENGVKNKHLITTLRYIILNKS